MERKENTVVFDAMSFSCVKVEWCGVWVGWGVWGWEEGHLVVSIPEVEEEDSANMSIDFPCWYRSMRVISLHRSCGGVEMGV